MTGDSPAPFSTEQINPLGAAVYRILR